MRFFHSLALQGWSKSQGEFRWLTGLWTITDRLSLLCLKILIMLAMGFISIWRLFLCCHEPQVNFCFKLFTQYVVYDNAWWWHHVNGTTHFMQILSVEENTPNHLLAEQMIRRAISTVLFCRFIWQYSDIYDRCFMLSFLLCCFLCQSGRCSSFFKLPLALSIIGPNRAHALFKTILMQTNITIHIFSARSQQRIATFFACIRSTLKGEDKKLSRRGSIISRNPLQWKMLV